MRVLAGFSNSSGRVLGVLWRFEFTVGNGGMDPYEGL